MYQPENELLKRVNFDIVQFRLASCGVESSRSVRLCGEDQIGHGYASTINKYFYRTFVHKDIKMIRLPLRRLSGAQVAKAKSLT